MFIVPLNIDIYCVRLELWKWLERSRFTASLEDAYRVSSGRRVRQDAVKIKLVRLKEPKEYCGQHPGACQALTRKHRKTRYLEGADWVAFSDMLNDMCDTYKWSADIFSTSIEFKGRLFMRKDLRRRHIFSALYVSHNHTQWDTTNDDYEFVFKIPDTPIISQYPDGTPGIPEWRLTLSAKDEVANATDERSGD